MYPCRVESLTNSVLQRVKLNAYFIKCYEFQMIKPMKFKSQNNSNMIGVKTEKKNEQIATTRCVH